MTPKFNFLSPGGSAITPEEWVNDWSKKFPRPSDRLYDYLVRKASKMTSDDLRILGAWKDGALEKSVFSGEGQFDPNNTKYSFNGKWKPSAASVAFETWETIAEELGGNMQDGYPPDPEEFLRKWEQERAGAKAKRFGLSRATSLLHFISGGRYPIFDKNVRRGMHLLTGTTVEYTLEWYSGGFRKLFSELARECKCETNPRKVEMALFAYGKKE